jgi:23S rRNA pseudouridine1911/1915/1917 synthase
MRNEVLYEDNHIIAVNKLPGDIVQADKENDETLRDVVRQYLKVKYNKPGNVFCGIVHRLDRPVSGAVLFARTTKALTRLNNIFRNREVKKFYWAVVDQPPPEPEGHLVHYLRKNETRNKSYVVGEDTKGALRAELKYRLIGNSDRYYLLEVELLTGRHHQIRVQLAHIGCRIKGDLKYGFPRPNPDASVHLHARSIRFIHPVKKELIALTARPPDDPLWDFFTEMVTKAETQSSDADVATH